MYKSVVLASAHRAQLIRVMQDELQKMVGFKPTWDEIKQLLEVQDVQGH